MGASYAFNSAENLAAPVDQRNNEIRLGTEWVEPQGHVPPRLLGQLLRQPFQTLTWDNPIRATDYNNGLLPPSGPYDSSGYSNGNGAAFGQAALWPSNNLNSAGATGMIKSLPRTTVNGNVQLTYMRQNESLLPWTLNTSMNNPPVLNAFPGLRQLPRATAETAVNATNAQFTFNSRLTSVSSPCVARYRYNDHDNSTPHFDGRQYVRMDAVPEELADDPNTPTSKACRSTFRSRARTSMRPPPSACGRSARSSSGTPMSDSIGRAEASAT